MVRVLLGDEMTSFEVAVTGPWRLTGPAGDVASGANLSWTTVAICDGEMFFGDQPRPAGPLELQPEQPGTFWIRRDVGGQSRERSYRGVLRILPTSTPALRAINVLPMEAYLAGVLANELPKPWNAETYKAQAVAARTYALNERNQRTRYDFDVHDSTQSQVYGGAGTETAKSWSAVTATWGIVATCAGPGDKPTLLKTYYHSTCGGITVPAGSVFGGPTPPPLAGGVPCNYCRRSPKYQWSGVVLLKQDIGDALRRSGVTALVQLGPVQALEVAATTGPGGRAGQIRVVDTAGASVLVQAAYWRSLVGAARIPSTWFEVEDQPDRIVLTNGRGYGHGVGLCQWGAEYLAERGKTGEEILRYYYPGVQLTRAY